jgi:hypothetical protein
VWDEAAVACQFHALNVEGSNPSPTGPESVQSSSGGMVDTVDLKFTPFTRVSVQLRGWVAGMVELGDTMDLGSIGFTLCKFNSCYLYITSLFRLKVGHRSF